MLTKNNLVKSNLYASKENVALEVQKIEAVNASIETKTYKTKETKAMATQIAAAKKAAKKEESKMTPEEFIKSFKEEREKSDAQYIAKKESESEAYKALLSELRGRNDIYCALVDKALAKGASRLTLAEALVPVNLQIHIAKKGELYWFTNDFGKSEEIYIPNNFNITYNVCGDTIVKHYSKDNINCYLKTIKGEEYLFTEEAFINAGKALHNHIHNICKVYNLIPEKAPVNWRYQKLSEVKESDKKFFSSYYKSVVQADRIQFVTFVDFINKLGNIQGYNTYVVYTQKGNQYKIDFNKRDLVEIPNTYCVNGPKLGTYIKDAADHFNRCADKGISVIDVEKLQWNEAQLQNLK